jgi:hypothetical protein
MFNVSVKIVDQDNNIFLLEDSTPLGECLANRSVVWMSANCENYNPIINAHTFCMTSRVELIIAFIDIDLTEFTLERSLFIVDGKLEMYYMNITGGERIKAFRDSLVTLILSTAITISHCQFSNMYFYCNTQIIYISLFNFFFFNLFILFISIIC